MRRYIIILWLAIPGMVYAQKLPEIGINVRLTANNKTIVAEIRPVTSEPNIDPTNVYYWYSSGNIHHTQGGFSGRLLNGAYSSYYLNKNIEEQGTYNKGLKNGIWKTWNETGDLKQWITYKNGLRSGEFKLYSADNKLSQTGNYDHDLLNGQIKTYTKDSVTIIDYKNGKPLPPKQAKHFFDKLNIFRKKK